MSYNKKVWKSGDRITKEALNNMENGIEAAHQNSGGTGSVAIVDNLNSDSSTSALSAKQGKELNNKMPAKSIVEGGKIYLAKEDGTKLDSGTELPASGSGTPYDDTEIKTDINTIKTDLGTEELTTTAKTVKGAVNEVAAQYKDIANLFSTEQTNSSFIIKYGNKIIAEIPLNSSGETEEPQNIVTNGLIINFDATNKKGQDSTTINNLVDNTPFTLSADSTTYNQNNGVTITESSTSGITIPIKDDNYGITDEITIEIGIIGAVDGYWSRGQAKCEVDTNSSYNTFLRVPYIQSSGNASIGAVAVSSNIINKSNTKIDEYRKKFHSITVRINASGDACLFVNGEKLQLPNNSTIFNIPGYKDLSNFLTETNNNFYFMKSTTTNNTTAVFCYGRIYKRALSDSEILNNYKVDSNKISKLGE